MAPPNDEGPAARPTPQENTQHNTPILPEGAIDGKRFESLRDRCDRAGFELVCIEASGDLPERIFIARYGRVRTVGSLGEVEALLDAAGVRL